MARQEDSRAVGLSAIRRAYAKQIMAASGVENARLEAALETLPREAFLNPGPWPIMRAPGRYEMTPDDNPVHLYQDVLVGIVPGKGLNTGQPSFLTFLISLGQLREGDHAVHVGAGQGYYTAIIALMVGNSGRVTAIEYEQELAIRAAANLVAFPKVRVFQGDGFAMSLELFDVIYVNAGAARPAFTWLDAMKDGARMVLPLTVKATELGHATTRGAVFLIQRNGDDYHVEWKSDASIYPCVGGRDESSEAALADALRKGGWEKVTRLYRTEAIEPERCWLRGNGWALTYW